MSLWRSSLLADLALYRRVLWRARPYWRRLVGLFLLSLLSSPLALLTPLPVKIALDSVIGSDPLPGFTRFLAPAESSKSALLLFAVALLIAVTLLVALQSLAVDLLRISTGEKLLLGFRLQLFRYAQRLSFSYSDTRGIADSIYRIENDAPAIQSIAVDSLIPFVTSAVTVVGMIYVTALIDSQLALVALGVAAALLIALGVFRKRLRRQSRHVKQLETNALSVVQEVLGALRVVRAFSQEDREQDRFLGKAVQGMMARLRLVLAESGLGLLVAVIIGAGSSAALYIGVRHVQTGVLTLGELVMVLSYLAQFYSPLKSMSSKAARLQNRLASAERAFELLDETPDVIERTSARPLRRAAGDVEFREVTYAYEDGRLALDNVSLKVPAGTRIGIAGTTGAGKSTLVSLLTRFYDPTSGEILLDGVDLRDYKLADLRRQFAIVLQDPVLFSTSIAENIAYANSEASRAEIVAAAKAAGAHEFVSSLPQGYDTPVGERGVRMSGGERQRIALARAFLRDAPVLILDEPTSSVDLSTEATILEALKDVMRGRTTFVIAHRPDTLQPCDVLITIEGGRAVSIDDRAKKPKRRAGARRKTPATQQSKTPSGARPRTR
jgi:ATP-binding cassette subfamily B protein